VSREVQFTGAPFRVGHAYIAYETSDGSLAVIEYDIRLNRYLLYRCEASGDRVDWGTCRRVRVLYVCGGLRVTYCAHSNPTSNVYVESIVCIPVWDVDIDRLVMKCPRREFIHVPWVRLRPRTRREVRRECRRWFINNASDVFHDFFMDFVDEAQRDAEEWANACFTMSEPFLDLLADYVEYIGFLSWRDQTVLRWCRCYPGGVIDRASCVSSRRWMVC